MTALAKQACCLLTAFLLVLAVPTPAYAEVTLRDLQIVARTLGFMDPPRTGEVRVGIIHDPGQPANLQQAISIADLMGSGLRSGNLVLRPSWINARQAFMIPSYSMALEDMTVRSLKAELGADTQLGFISASIYRNWIDDDIIVPVTRADFPSGIGSTSGTLDSQLTLVQLQDLFKIGSAHTLRITGEYRESQLRTFPYAGARVSYDVTSGGAMWNWQLAPTLGLTNALRIDRLELGRTGFVPSQLGLTNAAWDRTLTETSYNIGLVWNAGINDNSPGYRTWRAIAQPL